MEIRRRPPNPSVKVASLEYSIPHEDSQPRNILEKIVWEKDREVENSRKMFKIYKRFKISIQARLIYIN